MMDVRVQMFAFREPEIAATMDAVSAQETPSWADVTYEAWITPSRSDGGCGTLRAAESHPTFEAHEAPAGKLSSRNAAHDHALNSGADSVVAWDADAPPLSEKTLERLIDPLVVESVLATNSRPVSTGLVGAAVNLGGVVEDAVRPHLHGQCHALTAEAWDHIGPFPDVDETNIDSVREVEEFHPYRELSETGHVIQTAARVRNDTRRHRCHIEDTWSPFGRPSPDPWCDRRGVETFNPSLEQNAGDNFSDDRPDR
jgi:hypothetical protein